MVKKKVKECINGHKVAVILDNGLKIQLMAMENMNGQMGEYYYFNLVLFWVLEKEFYAWKREICLERWKDVWWRIWKW